MINEYGAVGLVRISVGNRSTRKKPAALPFFPQQILYDLSCDWTQAATVGSQHLIYLIYGTALNNLFIYSLFSNSRSHYFFFFSFMNIYRKSPHLWGMTPCWVTIIFTPHSVYAYTYNANITEISLGRRQCRKNAKRRMLNFGDVTSMTWRHGLKWAVMYMWAKCWEAAQTLQRCNIGIFSKLNSW
jgi:hypothetical protein